jgi:hypothetical protein
VAEPSTAESPLPWTTDALSVQISDVLARNFYEPEGALADVDYEGANADGDHVVWVGSDGSPVRIVVIVVAVRADGSEPTVRITFDD